MRRGLAGSTLLALIGIAALQAQPPTPTRTPTAAKRSPTAPGKVVTRGEAAQTKTGRPGGTNAPVRSDSAGAPPRMDADATSSMLSEVAAQYDDIESEIEVQYQKFMAATKSDSDAVDDQIAAMAEQIEKLKEELEKLEKMKASMDRLMPKFQEYMSSANSLYTKTTALEARAQKLKTSMELKRSMYIRTPVPKTRTPKPKG